MADALQGAAAPLHEAAQACPQSPLSLALRTPLALPRASPAAHAGRYALTRHLRCMVRGTVLRAALQGRLSWRRALPILNRIGGGQ